jgi:hemerythrin-like domain-containing protein
MRPSTCPLHAGTVVERVRREHQLIGRLLDDLERAASSAKARRPGGLAQLHKAVWDLYLAFQDHILFEESDLAPLLRAAGDDHARKMILEHNEERRVLLTLVEDSESDAQEAEALATQADELVARFRSDMLHEDAMLSSLVEAHAILDER